MCVIGLGKVGLGFAACLARNGFDVVGIDTDARLVDRINAGEAVSDEPGVAEVLRHTAIGRLRASVDLADAVGHGNMAFVLLPTPSRFDGSLDGDALTDAVVALCGAIRARPHTHERYTIVVGSTVSPGTMTGTVIPAAERVLERPVGEAVDICYNPELVALGSVVADFESPDLIIIGACDYAVGARVERVHRAIVRNAPLVHHLSLINGEIAKIALNNYLTVKISFANFLSQICAGIPGADIDAITNTLGSDGRIGSRFLSAGPAFGGPCFPRDTAALAAWAREHGQEAPLVDAVVAVNCEQHELLLRTVREQVGHAGVRVVGILGLAYKAGTPHLDGSPSVALLKALRADGVRIVAYDTRALDGAAAVVAGGFEPAKDAAACVAAASVIVLMHPESAYTDAISAYRGPEVKIVVDGWRALGADRCGSHITVVGLGQLATPT